MDAETDRNIATRPTHETYGFLQLAYDTFNGDLFSGTLPNCLITLQRRKRTYGYFSADRFGRDDGAVTDVIALNPSHFRTRPVLEILGTLAHEMVHLAQHHQGKPGRGRYHNREWAERMKAIGLQPTDTGEEGGKETGDRVHHYVLPDGPFDRAARQLLARGFQITWTEQPRALPPAPGEPNGSGEAAESKSGKRVKFTCPKCQLKAWSKHGAALLCGTDAVPLAATPAT